MPRGWYLAQGLIPLGESSSDDEEGPCELPDGRVVCGPHGQVVCYRCTSDYSFMDEVNSRGPEDEDDDEDEDESMNEDADEEKHQVRPGRDWELKRGSGQIFPTKFVPPSASVTPMELFSGRKAHMLMTRNDQGTAIIHTDGACLNNGQPNPRGGWGFWHGFYHTGQQQVCAGRLENKGPFGDEGAQTSNRAELRAVLAVLCFRFWPGEGFHNLVIATDSEYVVEGSTQWAKTWAQNGWTTRNGPVKNRDLWEALLGEVERFLRDGMTIQFWRIPRTLNTYADAAAKDAAAHGDAPDKWTPIAGINI